jgi:ribulose-phosphate 3-epimerase
MERLTPFVHRVHIDVADGLFTPVKSAPIDGIWWPGGVRADLHVMYQKPFAHTKLYLSLAPQMVIVHAEAEGDFVAFATLMQQHGIEVGVALKQETLVDAIVPALDFIDHVLVFSGDLGRFGGQASLGLLSKVAEIKRLQPRIEVGWDGGINNQNARALADGGVDVLNVGGFIQHAADPAAAYQTLAEAVK